MYATENWRYIRLVRLLRPFVRPVESLPCCYMRTPSHQGSTTRQDRNKINTHLRDYCENHPTRVNPYLLRGLPLGQNSPVYICKKSTVWWCYNCSRVGFSRGQEQNSDVEHQMQKSKWNLHCYIMLYPTERHHICMFVFFVLGGYSFFLFRETNAINIFTLYLHFPEISVQLLLNISPIITRILFSW